MVLNKSDLCTNPGNVEKKISFMKGRNIEERGNKRMFSAIKPFTSPRIIVYVFFGDLVFDMLSKPQSQ